MSSLKSLITAGILAGTFFLNSCGDKKGLESSNELNKIQTELEKYNSENKQIYEDFKKFCKENPNKKMRADSTYKIKLQNGTEMRFFGNGISSFSISAKDTTFFDSELNGLDALGDSYVFQDKKDSQIKVKSIQNSSPEEQLKVIKQYTNILKQILYNSK